MKTIEQKLFDLVSDKGEILTGDIHIIQTEGENIRDDMTTFRVYIKSGYCFDISKEPDYDVESDDQEPTEFYYHFYSEWEGFEKCTVEKAFNLLKSHF